MKGKNRTMELIEGIKSRRSVRQFTDEKVSRDTIEKIIDAARFAPTWKNSQTVRYVVIDSRDVMEKIADEGVMGRAHNAGIIRGAAALVVLTSVNGISGYNPDGSFTTGKGNEWQMFDAGIAAQTFCLSAHNYGVGSVIMGIFDEHEVARIILLDESRVVSALIAIGCPAQEPAAPKRDEVGAYVSFI